jgi:tetratricopeptide (TPR) repeat protein
MSPRRWLLGIALLAILAAAYWPVLGAAFSPWDDRLYTAENPLVRNGLTIPGLTAALSSTWENNWSPAFWIFLAVQVSLGGGAIPAVFHAFSVLLSLLNAGLLAWLARRFGISFGTAVVVAALFALHPLRVEAVAWISAQKHLLAAVFLLLALLFYQEAARRHSGKFFTLSLAMFAISLMSSQIGVGLPVFLLFWEAGHGGTVGRWKAAAGKTAGFFLIASAAAAVTLWTNWRPSAQDVAWFDHPFLHRALQAFGSLGWQVSALVWPARLAGFYPWPTHEIWLYAAVGGLALAGLAWAGWRFGRSEPLIVSGLAGFLACFIPVSGILAMPIEFTADRLSYVPSLFLTLALGAWLDRSLRRNVRWPVSVCGLWAMLLVAPTFRQAGTWRNERTIVDRTLSLYPDSVPAQINDAVLEGLAGNSAGALERFRKIRAKRPTDAVVWSNEMALLIQDNRAAEAIEIGKEAVRHIPRSQVLNYKVGVMLIDIGRPAEALAYLRKARESSPESVQPAFQLARALSGTGEVKEALSLLELLELSLQGDPDYWETRSQAHDRNGDWQKASLAKERMEILRRRQMTAP